MTDIPEALVEKAARARHKVSRWRSSGTWEEMSQAYRADALERERIVLAAVWPDVVSGEEVDTFKKVSNIDLDADLTAARLVVDRPDAARVLDEHPMSHRYQCLGCKMPLPPGGPSLAEHQVAMLLASGVVQDAADVRRAERERLLRPVQEIADINHDIQVLISNGHYNGSAQLLKLLSDLDFAAREIGEKPQPPAGA